MLHQFIQSYNILTVIFHFSHLSICFPTWYQQSNGGRRKKCLACTPSKTYLSESLMCFSQTKARSRHPRLTDPFWRFAVWRGAAVIPWFSLQIWDILSCLCCSFGCADVISRSGERFLSSHRSPRSHHLAICRLASSCPLLQSASPLCSMLLISTGASTYLHEEPQICLFRSKLKIGDSVKAELEWKPDTEALMCQFSKAKWSTMLNGVLHPITNSEDDLCFCTSNAHNICHFETNCCCISGNEFYRFSSRLILVFSQRGLLLN